MKYWIWLTSRKGLSRRGAFIALTYFGTPEAVYAADRAAYLLVEGLTERDIAALEDKEIGEAERLLADCYNKRIQVLTYQDAIYPERLRNIPDPPLVLYFRGCFPVFDEEAAVAVVGSRKASAYGLSAAKRLGFQMSRSGIVVVSGAARGVDSMALMGALGGGSPVVAVLGNGIDVIYPKFNGRLYEDVENNGCLISEYPPGTPPYGGHFPVRNRILSGLSLGVVVVEAGEKSGALITANHALEQGRDVFAVPSNVGTAAGAGSNRLLKEGAILVEGGWDVCREYIDQFPEKLQKYRGGTQLNLSVSDRLNHGGNAPTTVAVDKAQADVETKKDIDKAEHSAYIGLSDIQGELSEEEKTMIRLLERGPMHVDDLIDQAQLHAAKVLAAMTLLEVKGHVHRLPGQRYELARK